MAESAPKSPSRRTLLVLALLSLVHWPQAPAAAQSRKKQAPAASKSEPASPGQGKPLPPAVAEMREAILAAVRGGDIEELRYAIELNELRPELGAAAGSDPIAHLRTISGDGEGREILAALGQCLDRPYTTLAVGRDIENSYLYVWPALSEIAPTQWTPAQQVELLRLVTPAEAAAMRTANRWLWWRLAIGADGTWHTFVKAR